jgi:hypothetical protein
VEDSNVESKIFPAELVTVPGANGDTGLGDERFEPDVEGFHCLLWPNIIIKKTTMLECLVYDYYYGDVVVDVDPPWWW